MTWFAPFKRFWTVPKNLLESEFLTNGWGDWNNGNLTEKRLHKRKCFHKLFSFPITPFSFAMMTLFNFFARNIGVARRAPGDCQIREYPTRMREYMRSCVPMPSRISQIRTIRGTDLTFKNRLIIDHRLEDYLASLEALPNIWPWDQIKLSR
jgi:hypothetical protein